MSSDFEQEARAIKIHKLLEVIDRLSEGVDANTVYHWLKKGPPARWLELSELAGTKIPSPTTKSQVLGVLIRRAHIEDQKGAVK